MSELSKLVKLMKSEENAKTCLTREEAQHLIRKAPRHQEKSGVQRRNHILKLPPSLQSIIQQTTAYHSVIH